MDCSSALQSLCTPFQSHSGALSINLPAQSLPLTSQTMIPVADRDFGAITMRNPFVSQAVKEIFCHSDEVLKDGAYQWLACLLHYSTCLLFYIHIGLLTNLPIQSVGALDYVPKELKTNLEKFNFDEKEVQNITRNYKLYRSLEL